MMKHIKKYNNDLIKILFDKLLKIVNNIKELDYVDNHIVDHKNNGSNFTIEYRKSYFNWYIMKITIKNDIRGLNYKLDKVGINIDTIYTLDFKNKERIRNIIDFMDFIVLTFKEYIKENDYDNGYIDLIVPINKLEKFIKSVDDYCAYQEAKKYNL